MRMSLHKGSNPRSRGQPRNHRSSSSSQFLCLWNTGTTSVLVRPIPLLHLKHKVGTTWEFSSNLAGVYLDILHEIATSGSTFGGKNALCTGVGKGPIGIEVVKGFLSGGARIVIITSSYNRKTVKYYQSIFQSLDSRGSASTVIPFIQASRQDVEALINYIYNKLNMGFDYIIPFTGISENGYKIHGLYDCSELAHCMMLVNLLRILGCIKNKKASRHIVTRPTHVIHPLSPNRGFFGNDGLLGVQDFSRHSSRGRLQRVGVNTCAWLVLLSGVLYLTEAKIQLMVFIDGLVTLVSWH